MDDMHQMNYSYNYVAFFERKLHFFCNCAHIMTIMKKNYSITSIVQPFKAAPGSIPSRLCFIEGNT